jgi:hypothetical protein
MRRWASTVAVLAGLVFAAPALADSPAQVYTDFASDGTLSCGHSRAALRAALHDASLQQYGDPLTSVQMKLAIRKQLAGSCSLIASERPTGSTGAARAQSSPGVPPSEPTGPKQQARKRQRGSSLEPTQEAEESAATSSSAGSEQSGGMILLGIGLLLVALGSGGWAACRAFGDRG